MKILKFNITGQWGLVKVISLKVFLSIFVYFFLLNENLLF